MARKLTEKQKKIVELCKYDVKRQNEHLMNEGECEYKFNLLTNGSFTTGFEIIGIGEYASISHFLHMALNGNFQNITRNETTKYVINEEGELEKLTVNILTVQYNF